MRETQPAGLSPYTPPVRPGLHTPAQTAAGAPVLKIYPIAGRPAPRVLPISTRAANSAVHAARSVRMVATDVSVRLNHSMRAAAEQAQKLSAGAWCWVKFKTQWQFWLALTILMSVWFFAAQRPANAALEHAHVVYEQKYQEVAGIQAQVNALRQVYEPLRRGDPYAWQQLARHQLGWKQKSEVITVDHQPDHPSATPASPAETPTQATPVAPIAQAAPVIPAAPMAQTTPIAALPPLAPAAAATPAAPPAHTTHAAPATHTTPAHTTHATPHH